MGFMPDRPPLAQSVESYLASRPRAARWLEWLGGGGIGWPPFLNARCPWWSSPSGPRPQRAELVARAVERDWAETPSQCRDAYEEILDAAPG